MTSSEYKLLQSQYDKIYSYFKTTTELFDSLEWDGRFLEVIFEDKVIEVYDKETTEMVISLV